MLKKALGVSFFLYLVALLTSMAGMEMFGWLTFVLAMAVSVQERLKGGPERQPETRPAFFALGADWFVLALVVIVVLGYLFNSAPDTDFVFMIGSMRWAVMMYGIAYAFRWTGLKEKLFVPLMIVASLVSLHGIFEFFTGWDLIRQRHTFLENVTYGRASGFFSMPTTFAHAVAMTLCFPLAAVLLKWVKKTQIRWKQAVVVGGGILLLLALAMSLTRGVWISVFAGIAVMTLMVNWRCFVGALLMTGVVGTALYVSQPAFRVRIGSMADLHYASNKDRVELWRTNMLMFKEYPLLGIGLNDNERRTEEYNIKYGFPDAKVGNAHNTYLQFLSSTGALGLAAYLSFIGFYLWLTVRLWRVVPPEHLWHRVLVLGALGAQVTLHVGGLTDCNFKDMEVQHQFVSILAMLSYLRFYYFKEKELSLG